MPTKAIQAVRGVTAPFYTTGVGIGVGVTRAGDHGMLRCMAAATERDLKQKLKVELALRRSIAQQIDDVGEMLVRAGVVTSREILKRELDTERSIRKALEQQLDDVGRFLVQSKLITTREIQRHGVRFAVRNRLEPLPEALPVRQVRGR